MVRIGLAFASYFRARRRLGITADHRAHDLAVPAPRIVKLRCDPAVAHDDHPIGNLLNLIEPVRDEETAHALGADLADMGVKAFGLRLGKGGGGLVEDDQFG